MIKKEKIYIGTYPKPFRKVNNNLCKAIFYDEEGKNILLINNCYFANMLNNLADLDTYTIPRYLKNHHNNVIVIDEIRLIDGNTEIYDREKFLLKDCKAISIIYKDVDVNTIIKSKYSFDVIKREVSSGKYDGLYRGVINMPSFKTKEVVNIL